MNVLYVAHDKNDSRYMCPGSTVCLSLLQSLPANTINVQDCDVLRQAKSIPDWLNGTPILINDQEGIPYRGKEAIAKLRRIVEEYDIEDKPQSNSTNVLEPKAQAEPDIADVFTMDVKPMEETKDNKITEADLQKFMEQRNQSLPPQQQIQ